MRTYKLADLNELPRLADAFLKDFGNNQVFAFDAPMGAGKTTIIKALCEQMQIEDLVTSPTFAILNEYYTPDDRLICHYDFYRIEKPEEIVRTGFDEYLDMADMIFIEWPEKARDLIPDKYVEVKIKTDGEQRIITAERKG
jgi:tRNA threonylcarbamoyladenosine biosynthesis protein TsaE